MVDPFELVDEFGADAVRYYFLREVNFGNDGDYAREKFILRCNADLANDIGNLAQRSLSMVAKNCEGKVPTPGELTAEDKEILAACTKALGLGREAVDDNLIHKAVQAVWDVVGDANKYFANAEPWALKKTDPERMATVLYVTAEVIRRLGILALPVVPTSANKLLDVLAISEDARTFAHLSEEHALVPGVELPAPTPIFKRIEREAQA